VLPKRNVGLKKLLATVAVPLEPDGADRRSHSDQVVDVVAARSGAMVDGFHEMLVILVSKSTPAASCDAEASTLIRPISGLGVWPLASQTKIPDPRAAARNMDRGGDELGLLSVVVLQG
jgi:hypothetical protein